MRTLRQILLTEYIGAMLVAVLIADALSAIVGLAATQISYFARFLGQAMPATFRFSTTYSLIHAFVRVALFLICAYLIARWLYPPPAKPASNVNDQQQGP